MFNIWHPKKLSPIAQAYRSRSLAGALFPTTGDKARDQGSSVPWVEKDKINEYLSKKSINLREFVSKIQNYLRESMKYLLQSDNKIAN